MISDIASQLLCLGLGFLTAIPYGGSAIHNSVRNFTIAPVQAGEARGTVLVPTITTLQPTFEWTAPKEPGVVYDLVIYEGMSESHGYWIAGKKVHYCEGITTTRYTLEKPLSPNMIYVWSVRTHSGHGASKWAEYLDRDWSKLKTAPHRNDILLPFKTPGN